MLLKRGFYLSCFALATVFMVGGCASSVFPDFEDYNEIIVDDGGKVEIREVDARGILVSDKENASYEDDDLIENEAEEITPAKVVAVETAEIDPLPSEEQKELVDNLDETTTIVKEDEKVNEKVVIADEEDEDKITEPTVNYLAATIYFENGGAVVASSYNKVLRDVAKIVKDNNAKVMVYGFASSRTKDTDPASHKLANFKVSADRATNTAKALRRFGVDADKIITQALSDSMPMYQEVMPEGERLNRRAEIYLAY
ncbi:MAG: OmpA family protein [Alphaproteobacteria bacterium]|nr:OmpA family protein [Alphaproteobacteria bacterium]